MNPARILVAEDNEDNAELLREFLESRGYTVAFAPDGNRAIAMGGSGNYDLIILDVHMPLYEGPEVLKMLRARHKLRPVKVSWKPLGWTASSPSRSTSPSSKRKSPGCSRPSNRRRKAPI
jgi:hypothetical protein